MIQEKNKKWHFWESSKDKTTAQPKKCKNKKTPQNLTFAKNYLDDLQHI